MRSIILGLAVSLDSFIEGSDGEFDWCFTDQDYGMSEFFQRIDSVFMGRKSYELMQKMGEAAEMPGLPSLTEYIFSQTLNEVKPGATLLSGDTIAAARKIKEQDGKDIWLFGGSALTASLINAGLVDELWLSVHPILLGSGKPLFTGVKGRVLLELKESKTYDTGLVSLKYILSASSR